MFLIETDYSSHMKTFLPFCRGTVTTCLSAVGSEVTGSEMPHMGSTSLKWNIFALQLGSISCGAVCSDSQLLAHPPQCAHQRNVASGKS